MCNITSNTGTEEFPKTPYERLIMNCGRELSPTSVRNYISSLKKLEALMGTAEGNVEFLKDPDTVLKRLEEITPHSKKTYLAVILVVYPTLEDGTIAAYKRYQQAFNAVCRELTNAYYSQQKTAKEERNWVTSSELRRTMRDYDKSIQTYQTPLTKEQKKTLFAHLALAMFTMIPPNRREIGTVRILGADEDIPEKDNALKENADGTLWLHLGRYKTAKTLGLRSLPIPKELKAIIERSLKLYPRDYLFCQDRSPNRPLGADGLTTILRQAIPSKQLGVGILRKTYVSERFKNDASLAERDCLAHSMGHSRGVQALIYEKK